MAQARGGDTHAGEQALLQLPALVESVEHAGTEAIPCARAARDVFLRQIQRALPRVLAVTRAGEAALGEVDDDEFLHTALQQGASRMTKRDGVESAVGLAV